MIPSETMKILDVWNKNIFGEFSISEIMRRTGKKTKPWIFNGLKKLSNANLIIQRRKGNINLYMLDVRNPMLIQTLQFMEAQKTYNFPRLDVIRKMIDRIPVKCYCIIVFGSYAEGKQTKDSDLDICFLIESESDGKKIKPHFNDIKLSSSVDIDDHYITFGDFIKMLLREEENLGKQIFRNHKIFFCADIYYKLIVEAYKNGFRP
jgi:predicted nucleotidyltransferase